MQPDRNGQWCRNTAHCKLTDYCNDETKSEAFVFMNTSPYG